MRPVAIFTAHVGDAVDNFRSLAYENACNINLSGEARTSRPHPLGPRTRIRILNSNATKSLFKNGTDNFRLYSDACKHNLLHSDSPCISSEWVLIILMQVLALCLKGFFSRRPSIIFGHLNVCFKDYIEQSLKLSRFVSALKCFAHKLVAVFINVPFCLLDVNVGNKIRSFFTYFF